MTQEAKILEAIRQAAGEENKLSCKKAEDIAEEFGVSKGVIGRLCNDNKIKIKGCQLGCF